MKSQSAYTISKLAIPIAIEFLFQRLFVIADTLVLGNYSDYAVASVGYADQILSVSVLIFQVVSSGTSILLAQAIGSQDKTTQTKICTGSLLLSIILGIIVCCSLILFHRPLFNLLNVSPLLINNASDYITVMAFGQFFTAVYFTLTAIYRSFGNAKFTSSISIISNIMNILGDLLVVNGILTILTPVQDVALVTVFAKAFSCICAFIMLLCKSKNVLNSSISLSTFKTILGLGLPAAGESCSYKLSQLVGTSIIGSLGAEILTGKIYGMTFSSIMVIIPNAIAVAAGIIVGIQAGENCLYKAAQTVTSAIRKSFLFIVMIDIPLVLFGYQIIRTFYTDNPVIQKTAYFVLCAEALTMFFKSMNLTLGNSLRAIKDVHYPVIISIISMWLIGTGLCWLLGVPANLGIAGICIAFLLDETLRAWLLFRRWKLKTQA